MDEPAPTRPGPRAYAIRVRGHLGPQRAASFDGLDLAQEDDGTTVLRGLFVDQAALHGTLARLRDMALPLISVAPIDPLDP
jgi:hypothetical protein